MSNKLNLSSYSFFEDFDFYSKYQYIFNYNLLIVDQNTVEPLLARWTGKEELMSRLSVTLVAEKAYQILPSIPELQLKGEIDKATQINNKFTAQNNILNRQIRYAYDFRGLRIFNSCIDSTFHSFESSRLDYALFENSTFKGGKDVFKEFTGFHDISLNHAKFSQCVFTDLTFRTGEYNNLIFYLCQFTNVKFDGFSAHYSNVLFQNCMFDNVDFSSVEIETFCFFGECQFRSVKIDPVANHREIIGANIIQFTKRRDLKTFKFRQSVKGSTGKNKFIFFEKSERKRKGIKYEFTSYLYQGLASFYNCVSNIADSNGEYELYCLLKYNFSYCADCIQKNRNTVKKRARIFINRNFFGYGFKYHKTLVFIILLTLTCSFGYLFSGISYNNAVIKRTLHFDGHQLNATLNDWTKCLYFSLKAGTSVGFGDFAAVSKISLALSVLQGCLGLISYTVFIVILSRRFFK